MIDPHWYYLLVNLACLSVPLLFSFHPRLRFYRQWKPFAVGVLLMMLIFIPWDIAFTHAGIWGFNPDYLCGLYIANLPLEEWLFFICIPYACLFTYHCFTLFTAGKTLSRVFSVLPLVLAVCCLLVALLYSDRAYTLTTHLLCGLFLLLHIFVLKSRYLGRFVLVFSVLLLPFIVSNGLLTGLAFWEYPLFNTAVDQIQESIVWYNNGHNLRLRLFSMPVDDISYGFAMLLLVVTVYERIKRKPLS